MIDENYKLNKYRDKTRIHIIVQMKHRGENCLVQLFPKPATTPIKYHVAKNVVDKE